MTEREAEIGLWMALVSADGKVTDAELDVMFEAGERRFGSQLRLGEMSATAARAQQRIDRVGAHAYVVEIAPYLPRASARELLATAADIALADGLSSEEEKLIRHVAHVLSIDEASINGLIGRLSQR